MLLNIRHGCTAPEMTPTPTEHQGMVNSSFLLPWASRRTARSPAFQTGAVKPQYKSITFGEPEVVQTLMPPSLKRMSCGKVNVLPSSSSSCQPARESSPSPVRVMKTRSDSRLPTPMTPVMIAPASLPGPAGEADTAGVLTLVGEGIEVGGVSGVTGMYKTIPTEREFGSEI